VPHNKAFQRTRSAAPLNIALEVLTENIMVSQAITISIAIVKGEAL
jgi:hypothetical protein